MGRRAATGPGRQRPETRTTVKLIRAIRDFLQDVQAEFKRVSWPTREATLRSTGVVLFLTLTIAAFLGLVDLGLSEAVRLIIG